MIISSVQLDFAKLEELLSQRNFAEAKKMVDAVVDQELAPEERGEVYVKIAALYLDITNKINDAYIAQMDQTLDLIQQVTSSERSIDDKLKVAEIQQQLATNS